MDFIYPLIQKILGSSTWHCSILVTLKSIKKTVEKYIQSNETILNYLLTKEKNFTSENEHPLNIEFYKVRQECYQSFIKDLNEILKKVNVSIEKKSKKSKK